MKHPVKKFKSLRVALKELEPFTRRGDIVLDCFVGSGSALLAAERTGRKCYGIEIDRLYVDLAIRRWEAWTRGVARHAGSGRAFAEVARDRRRRRHAR